MAYITVEDFLRKAATCSRLSRQDEREAAAAMAMGDAGARDRLLQSYLPMVAGHIKGCKPHLQSLELVYACLQALETAVDSFNFLQESETFTHRLSWWLRQTTVEYIANRSS